MKKLVILILAAVVTGFSGTASFAQDKYGATEEQSKECTKYLSYYQEYFKQNDFESALPNWRKAFNICLPSASQNMFLHGATLYRQLIAKATDEEVKSGLIDTLLLIHDVRAENYPGKYAVTAINNKGQDIVMYRKDNNKFVYEELTKVMERNGVETVPSLLVALMNSTVGLFQEGGLSAEAVFDQYQTVTDLLDEMNKVNGGAADDAANCSSAIDTLLMVAHVADCATLVEILTPRLAADPNSFDTAKTVAQQLKATEGGAETDLYYNAVETMYRVQPSFTSATRLYDVCMKRAELDKITALTEEIVGYEEAAEQKAKYYFRLAKMIVDNNGDGKKAIDYAMKAVQCDGDNAVSGMAYMICATVWNAIVCEGNEIEVRAKYWVVVDYYESARRADPSLADSCSKQINAASKFFPATADAFMYDISDGQEYTVSCGGLTAKTTVRTQK